MSPEFRRKEDLDSLSQIPVIATRIEEMSRRLDSVESRFVSELDKICVRLDKIESLRERLAEVESVSNDNHCSIKDLRDQYIRLTQESNSAMKRFSTELLLTLLGVIASIVLTLLRNG